MKKKQKSPGARLTTKSRNFNVVLDSRLRGNDRTSGHVCHSRPDRESRKVTALPPNSILIVEDDNDLRETIVEALRLEGYRVQGAANAGKAIECVRQREVNIVFMDICLPDRNGLETYQAIKEILPASKTVMMTGFFVPDLVEAALAAGACDVLYKPFNMDDILKMIRKISA